MNKVKTWFLAVFTILAVAGLGHAIDSDVYTFYRQATSSMEWTGTTTGTPVSVEHHTIYTCQVETTAVTALTIRVVGNVTGSIYATSTPMVTHTCDTTDLSSNNFCSFSFVSMPVASLRMDVTTLTGTSVDKITCLGTQ